MLIFAHSFEFNIPVAASVTEHHLDIVVPEGTSYRERHEIAKMMLVAFEAFITVQQQYGCNTGRTPLS